MSTVGVERYLFGLPVPNQFEAHALELKHSSAPSAAEDPFNLPYIYYQAAKNPFLDQCIEFDIRQTCNHGGIAFKSPNEKDQFEEGIRTGYQFVISSVEYLHFLRSGRANFAEYVANIAANNELATVFLLDQTTLERLKLVRKGQVLLEAHEPTTEPPSSLAIRDATHYFADSPYLLDIFNQMLDNAEIAFARDAKGRPEAADEVVAFKAGFYHGGSQSVELYVQLAEERMGYHINQLGHTF